MATRGLLPEASSGQILRLAEVLARVGLGKTTLYRLIGRDEFPRPVRLGPRAVGWKEAEVAEWLDSRERAGSWR